MLGVSLISPPSGAALLICSSRSSGLSSTSAPRASALLDSSWSPMLRGSSSVPTPLSRGLILVL